MKKEEDGEFSLGTQVPRQSCGRCTELSLAGFLPSAGTSAHISAAQPFVSSLSYMDSNLGSTYVFSFAFQGTSPFLPLASFPWVPWQQERQSIMSKQESQKPISIVYGQVALKLVLKGVLLRVTWRRNQVASQTLRGAHGNKVRTQQELAHVTH